MTEVSHLRDIGGLRVKGRAQTPGLGQKVNPTVAYLLEDPLAAVPFLISRLDSTEYTEYPPACPGRTVPERVLAHMILTDLFSSDEHSTSLPSLCWASFLRYSKDTSSPDLQILSHEYGEEEWSKIVAFWVSFWEDQKARTRWDANRKFLFLEGLPLAECPRR